LPRVSFAAQFHSSRPAFVKVGDAIPNVELMEGSPGNKVNLANELKGKGLVIGVPAAYSEDLHTYYLPMSEAPVSGDRY